MMKTAISIVNIVFGAVLIAAGLVSLVPNCREKGREVWR